MPSSAAWTSTSRSDIPVSMITGEWRSRDRIARATSSPVTRAEPVVDQVDVIGPAGELGLRLLQRGRPVDVVGGLLDVAQQRAS